MAKSTNKTLPTDIDVMEFINSVEHETRRKDALTVLEMMKRITACEPVMWGTSLVGFDQYHYKYESGREGDFMIVGFSPRKANLVLYIMPGYGEYDDILARLGKYKIGKSCLYITNLKNVDMDVLEELITTSVEWMRNKYH